MRDGPRTAGHGTVHGATATMLRLIRHGIGRTLWLAVVCLALIAGQSAQAQTRPPPGAAAALRSEPAQPAIPDALTPETVDALMARLTDAEIRELLRDELRRRAEEQVEAGGTDSMTLVQVRERLTGMTATIEDRVTRWIEALANLGERRGAIAERLARAEDGVAGMIAAWLAVMAAGIAAALAVIRTCRFWSRWLAAPEKGRYWDRVVRSAALGVLEAAPVVAFVIATVSVAPLVAGALGPMVDYVWIYQVGVSYGWAFIVVSRRAFAPDAPEIRIAPLTDAAARQIHGLVRRSVQIGAGGWLLAGLSPTLGLGFPPALITVALAGTAVAALLLIAAVGNRRQIRAGLANLLVSGRGEPGALARIAVATAPALLIAYLALAWLYWLAHWLESGQQHLEGPAGTLVFLLLIPILDRLGLEVSRSLIRSRSPAALRYRGVLHSAWRMGLAIIAIFVVAGLWGLDLYALAKGGSAPRWASTLFDVAVTLLLANVVWRFILAALHTDRAAGAADAEDGPDAAEASRLDTLVPLLRNVLLTVLAVVVAMMLLAAAGLDIGPLLASAGIIGIAVGFGAQTLVRDIFSGAFFLIDDAFRVGEYIELGNDLRGDVESISLRSLQLRHHRGPVITIPFGELKSVTNHTRDWVIYKMSFRMEPDVDPEQVRKIVKEVGREFLAHPEHGPKFIEPLKSQGVYMIDDDSAQVFRVKFKCKPRAQFVLRREIYHRLREVFATHGIGFARRKVEVVGPEGAAQTAGAFPEEVLDPKPAPPSGL